jgi:eukaryotic-like serine/threonine-protein kinase
MTMRTGSEPGPGLELAGSVRLVEKLGEGGMGSVWTAQHLALHTLVAVKFLAGHMAQDAAAAARFQREAMAAARIKSPHVVQIFDHGVSSDFGPYIVMERLEGETLSAFVHRHGRLTPAQTARIVAQLCRALSKAHAQGIVHRDIKPDNVFLIEPERDAFVKVLDFGIAKNLRDELSVTSTGAMMGTPHYMSPEQMLSSKHVDLRADLWAVAVLAYHAMTGQVPFDGETFGAVAIAVTQADFAPIYPKFGVGSPELDAWFARALARDLNVRFTSADELAESFARAVGNGFSDVSSTGSGQRVAEAATFNTSPAHQPTFGGVSNTLPRRGQGKLYVAAGVLALGAALSLGLLLLRAPAPAAPPIAGTGISAASPSSALPAPISAPATSSPESHVEAPVSAPPSASAPVPHTRPPTSARPRPKSGPAVAPATANPARPDRGF